MSTRAWLDYFEGNRRPDAAPAKGLRGEVPLPLRAPLARSLARFQLGESAGGRVHDEVQRHGDPVLDSSTRRSVQLYIEEEWRHARELSLVIDALGGELLEAHWTNAAFTACRRLLGLRTKMMTLAIAEVVGIVYYRALARHVGSAALSVALERIAAEEARHLDFQAAFFERALALASPLRRGSYRLLLALLMLSILGAAVAVLLVDHGALLRRLRVPLGPLLGDALLQLRSRGFLSAPAPLPVCARSTGVPQPGLAQAPGWVAGSTNPSLLAERR